jgi:hypothetical protein
MKYAFIRKNRSAEDKSLQSVALSILPHPAVTPCQFMLINADLAVSPKTIYKKFQTPL